MDRTYEVAFEGWLSVESNEIGDAHYKACHTLAQMFAPLEAVGGSVEYHTGRFEWDKDQTYYADFGGCFTVEAEDSEQAFAYGFALMNAFVSPICDGGTLGDWEVSEVEEAGASKAPA